MNRTIIKSIQNEFLNFNNTGISFLETTHRSKAFSEFYKDCNNRIKNYLDLPDDYKVLWIQNEREFQYDMIFNNYKNNEKPVYLVNEGIYSNKAVKVCNSEFLEFKENNDYSKNPFVFYISDEGDNGFYNKINYNGNNLIADMSDDFLTKKIDFKKHKLVFTSTMPHLGANGIVLCLIKMDQLEKNNHLPVLSNYNNYIDNDSLYHTPSTHCIYFASKTFEYLEKYGINKEELIKIHSFKANKIYNSLDNNNKININQNENRSNSSILFKLKEQDNNYFIKKAESKGIYLEELDNKFLKYTNSIGKTEEEINDFINLFN